MGLADVTLVSEVLMRCMNINHYERMASAALASGQEVMRLMSWPRILCPGIGATAYFVTAMS